MSAVVVVAPSGATVRGETVEAKVQALSAGPAGRSAYRVAVDSGVFAGTEAEYSVWLKGADGQDGLDGADGQDGAQGPAGPLPTPVPKLITAREYTLVAGDLWKTLIFNSDYSVTVWVPEGLPDFTCTIVRNGVGTVSVRPVLGSLVVVNAPGDKLALGTRYESAVLRTVDEDAYVLKGADIAAPAYNYPITGLALTADSLIGGSPAGTYIGQLLPADIDSGEVFTFQILAGDGHFATDGDKLLAGATPTALTGSIDVWVRVTDSDHHTFDQAFTIALTPFYGADPTATVADFVLWRAWDGATQTEVPMTDFLAITRTTPGWAVDSQGVETQFAAGAFRHNDQGLLIERQVVNLVNNPDAPATQTITGLTAGAFVVWMRGTGSIAVTGGSSGNGTVNEATPLKVSLTGAGSLTLTLTGSVTFMQVQKLPNTARPGVPSTAVHGTGANATRNIDVITVQGGLKTALLAAPKTQLWEWLEPTVRWGDNRRLYRGAGGSQIMTGVITPSGALNASLTTAAGSQFSLTTNTLTAVGTINRGYIAAAVNNAAVAMGVELQSDTSVAPAYDTITTLTLGSRNDTNLDAFDGYLRKVTVYPRRLSDAEMVAPITTDLPPPPFVTYPAIEATGGAGGSVYTATTPGYIAARLQLTNPRKVVVAPTLTGREPYAGTVTVKSGNLTFRGNASWYAFAGGGMVVGDDTHCPENVIIEDVHFAPGNDDVGRNFDDRDGLGVWSVRNLIIRNCGFFYAIDEGLSLYKSLANIRVLENILIELNTVGPNLYGPVDGNGAYRKAEVPHNMGLLAADGITNLVIRHNLFNGNTQRNPVIGVANGAYVYNNIVDDQMQYGLMAFEQVSQFEARGSTIAFVNNLLKAGPNTTPTARAADQCLLRIGDGSGIYFNGNARTDGSNFANDTVLNGDTDVALFKGADRRSLMSTMPFGSPYTPMPAVTAADRQAIWNYVMNNVGVRRRDGSDAIITGDAGASTVTLAILNAVRNGTSLKISAESEFVGYPL